MGTRRKASKTRRKMISTRYSQQKIVTTFLKMLNTVKLYHWKTTSFAQHKATDELYSNMNKNIDSFIEIMLGKTGDRIKLPERSSIIISDYSNVSGFTREINFYKQFLINMSNDKNLSETYNTDLMTVRDELLGNLNQFSYLLTFK